MKSPVLKAALWMGGALMTLIMLAVSARELSSELHILQILFLRSVVSIFILLAVLKRAGFAQLRLRLFRLHVLRNSAHLIGQYCWIVGLAVLPLAEVFALEFTAPIWAMFIAAFFLGEKINGARLTALALGMAGVLIILRPGLIEVQGSTLLVLFGAFCFAIAHTTTKKLVGGNSPLNIVFYMTLIHLCLSIGPALYFWQNPSASAWMWIVVMACSSVTTHFCMAKAFALADSMVVIPLDFLRLPLIALVGYFFYSEGVDWFVMLGALVMFSGNFINIRAEGKKSTGEITHGH